MKPPAMTRSAMWTATALAAWLATGCPVYDNKFCSFDLDCAPGLTCDPREGVCFSQNQECRGPDECEENETCGQDALCHVGDCFFHGCVDGYQCIGDVTGYRCNPGLPTESSLGGAAGQGGAGGDSSAARAGTAGTTAAGGSGDGGLSGGTQ